MDQWQRRKPVSKRKRNRLPIRPRNRNTLLSCLQRRCTFISTIRSVLDEVFLGFFPVFFWAIFAQKKKFIKRPFFMKTRFKQEPKWKSFWLFIGFQIWFSDRNKFGLRSLNSRDVLKTEEGLAALHTLMNARLKYLYIPALFYCKHQNYI